MKPVDPPQGTEPAGLVNNTGPASSIQTTVLPGGLVVITEKLPYVRSVALGVSFLVGGRDDPEPMSGLAHMIEHMVFRGTEQKDAIAINIAAESLGAELNALTEKESTCFYARFPSDQTRPVLELLSEIVSGPAFRETDLAKEKEVISEEVRSSQEDPETRSANLMYEAVYGSQPMGTPIAGTLESVSGVSRQGISEFHRRFYGPGCAVAVGVGDVEHRSLVDGLAALLAGREDCRPPERRKSETHEGSVLVETRHELSQAYVWLAKPGLVYTDPRRYALSVLNTAFGGGVSSRLFQRLREQEGLVYSVGSLAEMYSDSGLLDIVFVTDARKLERCLAVIREELNRLVRDRLSEAEFERARNMTKSSVLLALESPSARMMRLARTWQLAGRVLTVDETVEAYNRLTRSDVEQLIDELPGAGFGHAGVVGPLPGPEVRRLVETLRA
jgi:predicted Zn-dependent peptidase